LARFVLSEKNYLFFLFAALRFAGFLAALRFAGFLATFFFAAFLFFAI